MKKIFFHFIALFLATLPIALHAESFTDYVTTCKAEVGFTSIPQLNCRNGILFRPNTGALDPNNDFVGNVTINANVDATFICRWSFAADTSVTAEMIVHNRVNGNTCFFSARRGALVNGVQYTPDFVSTTITSPTSANAADYWDTPAQVNDFVVCAKCHNAGPYIASPTVASSLAKLGLLNNGHDTFHTRYHVVGGEFNFWNAVIDISINRQNTCANACHVLGNNNTIPNLEKNFGTGSNDILALSMTTLTPIMESRGLMPLDTFSTYRWVNMDTPLNGKGDSESLNSLRTNYSGLYCANPSYLEAHKVGSDYVFRSDFGFSNKLRTFNLRDGLLCMDSDQPNGGICSDYQTHYLCSDGNWTEFTNKDTRSDRQDNEPRPQNVCPAPLKAIAIEAKIHERGIVTSYGPNDRLAQIDNKGLVCKNADQPDGKCSNYVVRFICP